MGGRARATSSCCRARPETFRSNSVFVSLYDIKMLRWGLWSVWLALSLQAMEPCEGKLPVAPGLVFSELPSHIQDHLQNNGYKDTSVFMPDPSSDKYLGVVESRPEHFPPPEMLTSGVLTGSGLPGLESNPQPPNAWHAPLALPVQLPPKPRREGKTYSVSKRNFKVVDRANLREPSMEEVHSTQMAMPVWHSAMPAEQVLEKGTMVSEVTQLDVSSS